MNTTQKTHAPYPKSQLELTGHAIAKFLRSPLDGKLSSHCVANEKLVLMALSSLTSPMFNNQNGQVEPAKEVLTVSPPLRELRELTGGLTEATIRKMLASLSDGSYVVSGYEPPRGNLGILTIIEQIGEPNLYTINWRILVKFLRGSYKGGVHRQRNLAQEAEKSESKDQKSKGIQEANPQENAPSTSAVDYQKESDNPEIQAALNEIEGRKSSLTQSNPTYQY